MTSTCRRLQVHSSNTFKDRLSQLLRRLLSAFSAYLAKMAPAAAPAVSSSPFQTKFNRVAPWPRLDAAVADDACEKQSPKAMLVQEAPVSSLARVQSFRAAVQAKASAAEAAVVLVDGTDSVSEACRGGRQ